MNKQKVVIYGAGSTADIVFNGIMEDPKSNLEPVAFCVDDEYYHESTKYGLPIVKSGMVEKRYFPEENLMIVAIGYQKMNAVRAIKCKEAEEKGYIISGFIHSKADVPLTLKAGKNTIILSNVSIGPEVTIGNNVCIFSGSVISHHAIIGDNVWIAPGTVVCGKTTIGSNSFLGANSTIGNDIIIGKSNFVGAGAVITKSTEDDGVYIMQDTPKYVLGSGQFMKMFKV